MLISVYLCLCTVVHTLILPIFLILKPMPKSINIMVTLGMHTRTLTTGIDKLYVYFVYFKLEKRERER